ncbi:MAG: TlpA disulfide reductase family protein [Thermodesulfobacteriota bacterium]
MAEEEKDKGLPKPVIAGIVVVVVAVVAYIVMSQSQKFEPVVKGSEAIDFTLPDLDGTEMKLSDFRGKVVFLNFWATWCDPCKEEIPSMQAMYESLQGKPFEIVAVSIDKDPPERVKAFAVEYGITFTVLHDRRGRIKDTYKTTGVPETFIIDQNGVVAEKVWGPRDWSDRRSLITILDLLENGPRPMDSYKKKLKKSKDPYS